MDTFNDIRQWLVGMRGSFPRISEATGLSTKTLGRIANDPEYSVTWNTIKKLQAAKASDEAQLSTSESAAGVKASKTAA